MNRILFWKNIFSHYIKYGFPLKALFDKEKLEIGLRNRGLLAYQNLDSYEPLLQKLILGVNSRSIFIDIGANIGLMSRIASQNSNFSQVIAYEPSSSFQQLTTNTSSNVQCFQLALIDAFDNGRLVAEKNAARDHVVPSDNGIGDSALIKSSDLLAGLSLDDTDLVVKVDIEGAESFIDWSIWLNCSSLKMLIIEVWDQSLHDQLEKEADALGFDHALYDAKFENRTEAFSEPINLVISR